MMESSTQADVPVLDFHAHFPVRAEPDAAQVEGRPGENENLPQIRGCLQLGAEVGRHDADVKEAQLAVLERNQTPAQAGAFLAMLCPCHARPS